LRQSNSWFFDSTRIPLRVLSDSSFSNGHVYFVLSKPDVANGLYVRADSVYVYYFNPSSGLEVPFFHLNALVGDTTHVRYQAFNTVYLTKIDTQMIFGIRTRVITYRLDGTMQRDVLLSEKFGPVSVWDYGDPPPPWPDYISTLTGCVLDSIRYGLVLSAPLCRTTISQFGINQNYPNPFNPSTTIQYIVLHRANITMFVADILGRTVRILLQQPVGAGNHSVTWDGTDEAGQFSPSGVYFCVMRADGRNVSVQKMLLLE